MVKLNLFEVKKSGMIKNEEILNYDYLPKILPYRENEIKEIANAIKPLSVNQNGDNLFIYGAPGIGKTASLRWVLREFGEYSDVDSFYINCWSFRTKYFIYNEIARQLNLSFTAGKSGEHILHQIFYKLKNKPVLFVFDEIDKAETTEFLYQLLSFFKKHSIILVSNKYDFVLKIEPRIRSRLMLKNLEFRPYKLNEIFGILKERAKLALKSSAVDIATLKQIANITYSRQDVRIGLFLLKETAKIAEEFGKNKIDLECFKKALKRIDNFVNVENNLTEEEQRIFDCIKELNGSISGKIFEKYKEKGGKLSYRSFRRYLEKLEKLGLIFFKETGGGFKGRSTQISLRKTF